MMKFEEKKLKLATNKKSLFFNEKRTIISNSG